MSGMTCQCYLMVISLDKSKGTNIQHLIIYTFHVNHDDGEFEQCTIGQSLNSSHIWHRNTNTFMTDHWVLWVNELWEYMAPDIYLFFKTKLKGNAILIPRSPGLWKLIYIIYFYHIMGCHSWYPCNQRPLLGSRWPREKFPGYNIHGHPLSYYNYSTLLAAFFHWPECKKV